MSEHLDETERPRHLASAYVRGDGTGFYWDCPRCHFYRNNATGKCRNSHCDGTVTKVEFRVIPPEATTP